MAASLRRPGYRLALATTVLAALVVMLGATTRLTHSGLGCPDWPGCYGFLGVPMSEARQALAAERFPEAPLDVAKGWYEMVHRYVAGSLGLMILALAIQAVRRRGDSRQPLRLPLALLTLVVAQALFGMWTVTLRLWPQVVTLHLLGGLATLALLWLLSLRLSGRPPSPVPAAGAGRRPLRRLASLARLLTALQIALGGWVSSNYAAVACLDFPTCQGRWWPPMDFANGFHLTQHIGPDYLGGQLYLEARTAIQVTHRLGAALLALVAGCLALALWRAGLARLAGALAAALVAQLAIGAAMVLSSLPLPLAIAHHAGAAVLLLVLVGVRYRLRMPAAAPSAARATINAEAPA